MRHLFILLFGLIISIDISYGQNSSDNDIHIINEIFPELAEKMYVSRIFPPPPPPPAPIVDSNDIIIGYDTTDYNLFLEKYNADLDKAKSDTQSVVIAISDSLFPYHEKDIEYIKNELPSVNYLQALNLTSDTLFKSTWINLNVLNNTGSFKLRYLSEFPNIMDIWITDYDFNFSGTLRISRLYLDLTSQYGIFYCSFSCGRLCGHGEIICIKKIKGKWTIEKTIGLWIS